MLPRELRSGSGMTCWRRLRDWQEGIWDLMHVALLSWLARDGDIDWSRAIGDSCSARAVCGGTQTGPNPTDRTKRGSKRHLACVLGDRGYDAAAIRHGLRARHVLPLLAMRRTKRRLGTMALGG